jgi:aspartate kinase
MQVFKFGGASVKDAAGIQNVSAIIRMHQHEGLVVVVSAMGKTTNELEQVVNLFNAQDQSWKDVLQQIAKKHLSLAKELLIQKTGLLENQYEAWIENLETQLQSKSNRSYTQVYDSIVPLGELFSTLLLSYYFQENELPIQWFDARLLISTNDQYSEAKVNFDRTEVNVRSAFQGVPDNGIMLTQGFIGSTESGYSTTLGREGSDYTASVLAYCLDAQKLVIWKDVPAVLNADPRLFADTIKLEKLSYREAIEMTYYGAQVIHPKTIKPLQNKGIPLQVRSFIDLTEAGTLICEEQAGEKISYPPIIVYKNPQVLFSISVKDFSFATEDNLSHIFQEFSAHGLSIRLMHNGAISFSAVVDHKPERVKALQESLSKQFEVRYNADLELLTIRHYTQEKIDALTKNKEILLTQKTRSTVQFLMRSK